MYTWQILKIWGKTLHVFLARATIFSLLLITEYRNGTIKQKSITYYMTSFGLLRDVKFASLNLFRCRHWEISSDLLFCKFLFGWSIIPKIFIKAKVTFFQSGFVGLIMFYNFICKCQGSLFVFYSPEFYR